jgi:hypothetical protein
MINAGCKAWIIVKGRYTVQYMKRLESRRKPDTAGESRMAMIGMLQWI